MKKRISIVYLVAGILLFSGCSNNQGSSNTDSELDSFSGSEASSMSDVASEKTIEELEIEVREANLKAAEMKNNIDTWIVSCDANGAYFISGEYTEIELTVKDGVWSASVSNPQAFKSSSMGQVEKTGAIGGTSAGDHTETDNYTELLEIELANANTDIDEAYIFCAIYKSRCKSLYYVSGSCYPVPELNENIGEQADWIDSTYGWSGKASGVLSDGTIVGTAPNI